MGNVSHAYQGDWCSHCGAWMSNITVRTAQTDNLSHRTEGDNEGLFGLSWSQRMISARRGVCCVDRFRTHTAASRHTLELPHHLAFTVLVSALLRVPADASYFYYLPAAALHCVAGPLQNGHRSFHRGPASGSRRKGKAAVDCKHPRTIRLLFRGRAP